MAAHPWYAFRGPPVVREIAVNYAIDAPAGAFEVPSTRGVAAPGAGAEVAQLVEHTTENRGVGSSTLPLGTNHFDRTVTCQ